MVLIVWVPFRALHDWPRLLRRRLVRIGTHDRHKHPAIPAQRLYPLRPACVTRRPPPRSDDAFGDASASSGGTYTLELHRRGGDRRYIADGRHRRAIGSIFGAFVLRNVSDLLFVFDIDPLVQPFIQGLILLAALSLGAVRVLRAPTRLQFLGVGR